MVGLCNLHLNTHFEYSSFYLAKIANTSNVETMEQNIFSPLKHVKIEYLHQIKPIFSVFLFWTEFFMC